MINNKLIFVAVVVFYPKLSLSYKFYGTFAQSYTLKLYIPLDSLTSVRWNDMKGYSVLRVQISLQIVLQKIRHISLYTKNLQKIWYLWFYLTFIVLWTIKWKYRFEIGFVGVKRCALFISADYINPFLPKRTFSCRFVIGSTNM